MLSLLVHLLAQLKQNFSALHCLEVPAFSCTLVRVFNNCGFTIIHFISLRYLLSPHFLAFLSRAVPRRLILNKKMWTNIILYNSCEKPLGCMDGSKPLSSAGTGSALYGRHSDSFRHAEFLQSCIWMFNLGCQLDVPTKRKSQLKNFSIRLVCRTVSQGIFLIGIWHRRAHSLWVLPHLVKWVWPIREV